MGATYVYEVYLDHVSFFRRGGWLSNSAGHQKTQQTFPHVLFGEQSGPLLGKQHQTHWTIGIQVIWVSSQKGQKGGYSLTDCK